jgi:hypothetical protein
MDLNINARFLVLSDIHRKVSRPLISIPLFGMIVSIFHITASSFQVMFVVHLEHDDTGARFCWINEFSLPVNMIGFNVCNASFANMREIAERGFQHFGKGRETIMDL